MLFTFYDWLYEPPTFNLNPFHPNSAQTIVMLSTKIWDFWKRDVKTGGQLYGRNIVNGHGLFNTNIIDWEFFERTPHETSSLSIQRKEPEKLWLLMQLLLVVLGDLCHTMATILIGLLLHLFHFLHWIHNQIQSKDSFVCGVKYCVTERTEQCHRTQQKQQQQN